MPHETKIFFDTEFMEDGRTIELLSIGLVREDGAELYMESREADWTKANDWVIANVLPKLSAWPQPCALGARGIPAARCLHAGWSSRREIADAVKEFVGPHPEFWAYYADYDWVAICQLYGRMLDLPEGWPMYCMDFKQLIGPTAVPKLAESDAHNALADARWLRDSFTAFYTPRRRTP